VTLSLRKILTLSLLPVLLLVAFFNLHCGEQSSQNQSPYLNHHDSVKYVGMDQCRACHNQIYETFIQTGMGQSFDHATRKKSAAIFGKHQVVYDKYADFYYHPYWQNDTMYIMEFRLQGKDTIHKRIERVDYIIGSGQHTNSHLTNINGFIYQLPLTWYAQKQKWDLPPGFEDGKNVRFSRAIGIECMSCHNAIPKFEAGSMNKFISIPNGIDCERCHGPGELHVKEKLAGNSVDTANQIDYTIVNPRKLPWDLQIDLCQRCHLQGNAVLKPGKQFTDFRPGRKLSDFVDIYMPKYKGKDDEFIMASHAQRLQMSKCFVEAAKQQSQQNNQDASWKTANALTCISCHNPHVSVKVTGTQIFNKSCNNCHSVQAKNYCTEKADVITANQSNCVKCHMPKSGTIDIPHVTVTDHWIRVPAPKKVRDELKEFVGIYCINNTNSNAETRGRAYLGYVEKFSGERNGLDSAMQYFNGLSGNNITEALVHLWYLKSDYNNIVQTAASLTPPSVQQAWFCYRIGRSYYMTGDGNNALKWYERAVELAPENLDFINAMGSTLVEMEQLTQAEKWLQTSIQKNPKQPEPLTNYGFLLAKKQQFNQAMEYYNKALSLDPDFDQALLNKAAVLNLMGKKQDAIRLLQQIIKRNPQNTMVKQLLQQLQAI